MSKNRKIGLIAGRSAETLVKNLKNLDLKVFLFTGNEDNKAIPIADKSFVQFITINDKESIKSAVKWFVDQEIEAIILGTGIWFAHEIAIELNKRYNIPLSHNPEFISTFKSKSLTKELFIADKIPTPKYILIKNETIPSFINFPKVIKSDIDLFPVWLCHTKEEFDKWYESLSKEVIASGILIEDYYDGSDFTVPIFATRDNVKAPLVVQWSKQKNYKLKGFSEYQESIIPKKIQDDLRLLCENFISKLGYFGVARADIRYVDENNYYFLEINSVISIREEGSSYQAFREQGINLINEALKTYLYNLSDND